MHPSQHALPPCPIFALFLASPLCHPQYQLAHHALSLQGHGQLTDELIHGGCTRLYGLGEKLGHVKYTVEGLYRVAHWRYWVKGRNQASIRNLLQGTWRIQARNNLALHRSLALVKKISFTDLEARIILNTQMKNTTVTLGTCCRTFILRHRLYWVWECLSMWFFASQPCGEVSASVVS